MEASRGLGVPEGEVPATKSVGAKYAAKVLVGVSGTLRGINEHGGRHLEFLLKVSAG